MGESGSVCLVQHGRAWWGSSASVPANSSVSAASVSRRSAPPPDSAPSDLPVSETGAKVAKDIAALMPF